MAIYIDNVGRAEEQATGVLEVPSRGDTDLLTPIRHRTADLSMPRPYFLTRTSTLRATSLTGTSREVAENTMAGADHRRRARSAPRDEDDDLLIYTLSGRERGIVRHREEQWPVEDWSLSELRGQEQLHGGGGPLPTRFGAADSIQVTINVTDVDGPSNNNHF